MLQFNSHLSINVTKLISFFALLDKFLSLQLSLLTFEKQQKYKLCLKTSVNEWIYQQQHELKMLNLWSGLTAERENTEEGIQETNVD